MVALQMMEDEPESDESEGDADSITESSEREPSNIIEMTNWLGRAASQLGGGVDVR